MATVKLVNILALIITTSCITATVILVLTKYDLFNKYELNRTAGWPKVCYLCFGFWVSLLITPVLNELLALNMNALELLISAFACASVVRKLTTDVTV